MITDQEVKAFVAGCQKIINEYVPNKYVPKKRVLSFTKGRRYAKVVEEGRGVFAFVDLETGDVLKAASWKAPAKHARGNLKDKNQGLAHITQYGPAYLGHM